MNCRQCNKELPEIYITDICSECSKKNVKALFRENPELKQAFIETVEEMKRPENLKKASEDFIKVAEPIMKLHNKITRRENHEVRRDL